MTNPPLLPEEEDAIFLPERRDQPRGTFRELDRRNGGSGAGPRHSRVSVNCPEDSSTAPFYDAYRWDRPDAANRGDKELVLVAGLQRLRACKSLGWTQIPAVVRELDGLTAELAEIDENLIRNDLTVLERSEQLARRKEIYEALHLETKQGGAPGKAGGGKAKNENISSFAKDTAEKSGLSARTVQPKCRSPGRFASACTAVPIGKGGIAVQNGSKKNSPPREIRGRCRIRRRSLDRASAS